MHTKNEYLDQDIQNLVPNRTHEHIFTESKPVVTSD